VGVKLFEIMHLDKLPEELLCGRTDSGLRALGAKSSKSFGMMVTWDGIGPSRSIDNTQVIQFEFGEKC
jgi:hypothetical protein